MSFADLGLIEELTRAVSERGYTEPTPIQREAIPVILAGRDVMAGAQTGTGKTAGFTLPLLQRLAPHASVSVSPARHPVRALALAPTRELAVQVADSVTAYSKYLKLRSTVVYGGVAIQPQEAAVRAGVEILVATPGRLLDHVQQKTLKLNQVEILVLDEADRMLDMGFMPDIQRILALLPRERQNLLFSATFPKEIQALAGEILRDPVVIQVSPRNAAAETVRQQVMFVAQDEKRATLARLIRAGGWHQTLVFTRTKIETGRLARQLDRDGINAAAIHGDKSQGERIEALEKFKKGEIAVLVATDVAARGLDIQELPRVVNFELPRAPEDYIHRIGRTGRAGNSGEALSLVSDDELKSLAAIENLLKRKLEVLDGVPGVHASPRFGPRSGSTEVPSRVEAAVLPEAPYEPQAGGAARHVAASSSDRSASSGAQPSGAQPSFLTGATQAGARPTDSGTARPARRGSEIPALLLPPRRVKEPVE